jgi:hypothetical protein
MVGLITSPLKQEVDSSMLKRILLVLTVSMVTVAMMAGAATAAPIPKGAEGNPHPTNPHPTNPPPTFNNIGQLIVAGGDIRGIGFIYSPEFNKKKVP